MTNVNSEPKCMADNGATTLFGSDGAWLVLDGDKLINWSFAAENLGL
jgi:hypothetical protein